MVFENILTALPRPYGMDVTIFLEILNPEGHPNRIIGSKVTAYLLNGWILPICGASAGKGLRLQPAQQACLERLGKNSYNFFSFFSSLPKRLCVYW